MKPKITQGIEILHPNKNVVETLKTVLKHNEMILEMNAKIIQNISSPIFSIRDRHKLSADNAKALEEMLK